MQKNSGKDKVIFFSSNIYERDALNALYFRNTEHFLKNNKTNPNISGKKLSKGKIVHKNQLS